MKLSEQIKRLPAGKIIQVKPSQMRTVYYHAHNFRDITSRVNLKTGARYVLLGEFFRATEAASNER